jgi:hypothetical protein
MHGYRAHRARFKAIRPGISPCSSTVSSCAARACLRSASSPHSLLYNSMVLYIRSLERLSPASPPRTPSVSRILCCAGWPPRNGDISERETSAVAADARSRASRPLIRACMNRQRVQERGGEPYASSSLHRLENKLSKLVCLLDKRSILSFF